VSHALYELRERLPGSRSSLMLVAGFKSSQRCGTCCTPTRIGMDSSSNPANRVALTVKIMNGSSRLPAGFRSRLSRCWRLSPSCCGRFCRFGCDRFSRLRRGRLFRFDCGSFSRFGYGRFSRFGHGFNRSRQFRPGRFRSAMVAMVRRLDARSFFFRPQLSAYIFSALVLEVFRNRFSCHGCSVAEVSRPRCPILANRRQFLVRHSGVSRCSD
jgi:hypothetical protein